MYLVLRQMLNGEYEEYMVLLENISKSKTLTNSFTFLSSKDLGRKKIVIDVGSKTLPSIKEFVYFLEGTPVQPTSIGNEIDVEAYFDSPSYREYLGQYLTSIDTNQILSYRYQKENIDDESIVMEDLYLEYLSFQQINLLKYPDINLFLPVDEERDKWERSVINRWIVRNYRKGTFDLSNAYLYIRNDDTDLQNQLREILQTDLSKTLLFLSDLSFFDKWIQEKKPSLIDLPSHFTDFENENTRPFFSTWLRVIFPNGFPEEENVEVFNQFPMFFQRSPYFFEDEFGNAFETFQYRLEQRDYEERNTRIVEWISNEDEVMILSSTTITSKMKKSVIYHFVFNQIVEQTITFTFDDREIVENFLLSDRDGRKILRTNRNEIYNEKYIETVYSLESFNFQGRPNLLAIEKKNEVGTILISYSSYIDQDGNTFPEEEKKYASNESLNSIIRYYPRATEKEPSMIKSEMKYEENRKIITSFYNQYEPKSKEQLIEREEFYYQKEDQEAYLVRAWYRSPHPHTYRQIQSYTLSTEAEEFYSAIVETEYWEKLDSKFQPILYSQKFTYLESKDDVLQYVKHYSSDGKLISHYLQYPNYGLYTHYLDSGSIEYIAIIQNNERNGILRRWHKNSIMAEESYWENGKRKGPIILWNENGEILFEEKI